MCVYFIYLNISYTTVVMFKAKYRVICNNQTKIWRRDHLTLRYERYVTID